MRPSRYRNGIIHCHSSYSYDSFISISAYLKIAKRNKLDFIIITDHDTIAGAQALRAEAARFMPELEVPLAGEYLTDEGDVIAAFISNEIGSRTFSEFAAEARQKDGVLLLPHPYVGHRSPETIAGQCDLIETVNCRTTQLKNLQAGLLAASLGKRAYAGSDAHFERNVTAAVLQVEDCGNLRTSLLRGRIRWHLPRHTTRWEYGASQLIKSWKRRDARLAMRLLRNAWRRVFKAGLPRAGSI
jgi:predicted metal-dependent phosphoesterase TrpH